MARASRFEDDDEPERPEDDEADEGFVDADDAAGASDDNGLTHTDKEILSVLDEQRNAAIGFNNTAELSDDREQALAYFQGKMEDMQPFPDRAGVVDTAVRDAVETILPDLVDIFTGEDIVSFTPREKNDEAAARQETDYLSYIIWQANPGFLNFVTAIKDALILKTGVWKFWWEDQEDVDEQQFHDMTEQDLALARNMPDVEVVDIQEVQPEPGARKGVRGTIAAVLGTVGLGQPTLYSYTIRRTKKRGYCKYRAIPAEDFAVGEGTVWLPEAHYCAYRTRPLVQDLIADGYDPDLVRALPAYDGDKGGDDEVSEERDTVDENDEPDPITDNDLRRVEIVEHFLRIDLDDTGKPQLWRFVTGGDQTKLLYKGKRSVIEFAAITPMLNPHRFIGTALADLLIEIQQTKTSLLRSLVDTGYFALNQRIEVSEEDSNEFTVTDLLRNAPGIPVRSRTGNALKAISGGGVSYDIPGAIEYISVMAEQRSGVMRNAQGLSPDTMHETARGMLAMLSQAQRRTRLVAKTIAETGVKDLFLGMHVLTRENASSAATVRLRGEWTEVDPTAWGRRQDMSIEIGIGSGGKDSARAAVRDVMALQKELVEFQGGKVGPLVDLSNLYAAGRRYIELAGLTGPEQYIKDPAKPQAPAPGAEAGAPQGPAPEVQAATIKAESDLQAAKYKADKDAETARYKADLDAQLEREKMAAEAELAEFRSVLEAQTATNMKNLRPGGALDA